MEARLNNGDSNRGPRRAFSHIAEAGPVAQKLLGCSRLRVGKKANLSDVQFWLQSFTAPKRADPKVG
jgi:hypothetical protein